MTDRMTHNQVMYWSSDGAYDVYSMFLYVSIPFLWFCAIVGSILISFGFVELGVIGIFTGLFSVTLLNFLEMRTYKEMKEEYQEEVINEAIDD